MSAEPVKHINRITFDDFKQRAQDPNLSVYEKIGFPDDYRQGKEINIFNDIKQKLKLDRKNISILDIGCGCSDLLTILINNSRQQEQTLLLNDCQEMLDLTNDEDFIVKIPGKFPDCFPLINNYVNKLDVVIAYSVMHHVTIDSNPFTFY